MSQQYDKCKYGYFESFVTNRSTLDILGNVLLSYGHKLFLIFEETAIVEGFAQEAEKREKT